MMNVFSTNLARSTGYVYLKKSGLLPHTIDLSLLQKNSRCKCERQNNKILEENRGECLYDVKIGKDFLNRAQNANIKEIGLY